MARFELTGSDEIDVRYAHEALAASKALDLSDPAAMARMLGRLEVVIEGLLAVLDAADAAAEPSVEGGEV
ncbi:hypothetical protein [Streptomyces sp. NPDC059994]|uniref:hypothetical protein n=1 Tax=Streptomyces sp. NPDC059994 TaxID=3347029 RepID=UPI0036855603